jgi:hypothetical protein
MSVPSFLERLPCLSLHLQNVLKPLKCIAIHLTAKAVSVLAALCNNPSLRVNNYIP